MVLNYNYKIGLFRIWLVLSFFWIVVTVWTDLSWAAAIGVPIAFGVVFYLLVWAIRRFGVKARLRVQTFDLIELPQLTG